MSEEPTIADYEEVLADHRRLVRRLDVAINGESGAAKQASLCDIVGQIETSPMITLQAVSNALCHHCMTGTAFEDTPGWPPKSWHEWWQDGRNVGRVRCTAADFRRQLSFNHQQ